MDGVDEKYSQRTNKLHKQAGSWNKWKDDYDLLRWKQPAQPENRSEGVVGV